MYAIVDIQGFQYRLTQGQRLKVPKCETAVGETVTFPEVLFVSDDAGHHIGTPFVDGAVVEATVTDKGKYDKITVFKKKRRKDYSVKRGHRQDFTEIEIDSISMDGKSAPKKKETGKAKKTEKTAPAEEAAAAPEETVETVETEEKAAPADTAEEVKIAEEAPASEDAAETQDEEAQDKE